MFEKPMQHTSSNNDERAIFYLERTLDLIEKDYRLLAKRNFDRYDSKFEYLLSPSNFQHLRERIHEPDNWTLEKEEKLRSRMNDAWLFKENQSVYNCSTEILLHYPDKERDDDQSARCQDIEALLAKNTYYYLEPDDVTYNTFIDAEVMFIVDKRSSKQNKDKPGNPGFYLSDVLGQHYRCFIKSRESYQVGDRLKLKITNVTGLVINSRKHSEMVIYCEPRVSEGDFITIELSSLSHTKNSFTFRHYSYDGFLWFKKRGVNKELFNKKTLRPQDVILARVLYTTEEVKMNNKDIPSRLGLIKAIPIKRIEQNPTIQNQGNDVANSLNSKVSKVGY